MGDAWYKTFFCEQYWRYARDEYGSGRTEREVDYLQRVLTDAPGARVLDVGCGTGRHAVPLSRAGFDVVGLDVSEWAVGEARKAAADAGSSARFEMVDVLAEAELPVGDLDAVYAIQSFGWGTDADQLNLLKRLRRHLVPGGLLILDYSGAPWLFANYKERSEEEAGGATFTFVRNYDAFAGRSRGEVVISRAGEDAVRLRDDVRLYTAAEVVALVREAGFAVERVDAEFEMDKAVTRETRYAQVIATALPVAPRSLGLATMGSEDAAGSLDLRWAVDEAGWLDPSPADVWSSVIGTNPKAAADASRRYALADPFGAERAAPVLSRHFRADIAPAQIAFAAGVTSLLRHACELAGRGDVLAANDAHPDLLAWAASSGSQVRIGRPDDVRGSRVALVLLDRPSIDGDVLPLERVASLAHAWAEAGAALVLDESHGNYLEPGESAVPLAADHSNLVVLRGFSKAYSWGGLRVGYAVCSALQAERLRETLPPLQVSETSFLVAMALLDAGDVAAPLRARLGEVKPRTVTALERAGLDAVAGHPALPWVLVADDGGRATAALTERGVLTKRLVRHGGQDRLRLSVPLSEERVDRFNEAFE